MLDNLVYLSNIYCGIILAGFDGLNLFHDTVLFNCVSLFFLTMQKYTLSKDPARGYPNGSNLPLGKQ
jgi:hypothetical protein